MLSSASPPHARWELYRVLSEPLRLRLLALVAEEELTIGELAELLSESQPNVSRHTQSLKQLGVVSVRKQGTRALVSAVAVRLTDPVIWDALSSGRDLCKSDGSLARVPSVMRARDEVGREYFSQLRKAVEFSHPAPEFAAYLRLLAPLLPERALALDAGTGDGSLLDIIAPVFRRVLAVDRSSAQLDQARERVRSRGYDQVKVVEGELGAAEVRRAVGQGADVVFAARLLHHAPAPAQAVAELARLCRSGGRVVILDYVRHDDESMRDHADLWLGFSPEEWLQFAAKSGLQSPEISAVPPPFCGNGPDAHLLWQVMLATKP